MGNSQLCTQIGGIEMANKYEFTEQETKNALAFLSRVELKGAEAPAYMAIVQKLMNPIKEGGEVNGE